MGHKIVDECDTHTHKHNHFTALLEKDCQACKLNKEDAMDHSRWRKQIEIFDTHDRYVGECFFWYWLTRVVPVKVQRAVKWLL